MKKKIKTGALMLNLCSSFIVHVFVFNLLINWIKLYYKIFYIKNKYFERGERGKKKEVIGITQIKTVRVVSIYRE